MSSQSLSNFCQVGDLPAVIRTVSEASESARQVISTEQYVLRVAARSGHLHILRWLLEESSLRIDATLGNANIFRSAVENRQLSIVKYFLEEYPTAVAKNLAWKGRKPRPISPAVMDNYAFRTACRNGDLEIVKYLVDNFEEVDVTAKKNAGLRDAMFREHDDVIRYLLFESGKFPQLHQAGLHNSLLEKYKIHEQLFLTTIVSESFQAEIEHHKAALLALERKRDTLILQASASETCRAAVRAGMIRDLQDVEKLLKSNGELPVKVHGHSRL